MDLRLSFDLHCVGPRRAVDAGALWLAVKIGSSYAENIALPDQAAGIPALMPWSLLSNEKPIFRLLDLDGFDEAVEPIPAQSSAFIGKLQEELVKCAVELAARERLTLGWSRTKAPGEHVEEGDEEGEPLWPWLGLSSSIAALPAALSRPLHARWLIELTGDLLIKLRKADPARIILVPETIHDANRKVAFTLDTARTTVDAGTQDLVTLHYLADGDEIIAFTHPLPAEYFLGRSGDLPIPYWLEIGDSRDDSLADVDAIIAENADPVTLAAMVATDKLGGALTLVRQNPAGTTPPLPAHVAAVAAAVARKAAALGEQDRIASAEAIVAAVLSGFSGNGAGLADEMADRIADWWAAMIGEVNTDIAAGRLPLPDDAQLATGDRFELDRATLATAIKPLTHAIFKTGATPRPAGPGEAIDFVVGDVGQRLVGEGSVGAELRDPLNEMAEFGILVRRASDSAALEQAPWRMVSAGYPVLDPGRALLAAPWGSDATSELEVAETLVPRGIALAFKDGVLRNDDSYRGQSMIGPDALSHVHDESAAQMAKRDDDDVGIDILAYVSGRVRDLPDHAHTLAPALRYGDHYQLAGFVIDRAGGLPAELAQAADPTALDPAALPALPTPKGACEIHFKRRFPLGDINVKPEGKAGWLPMTTGVVLRSGEWLSARRPGAMATPALLFGPSAGGKPAWADVPNTFRFTVEPPRIDEQTLLRWALPPTDAPPAEALAAITALKAAYVRIADERARLNAEGDEVDTASLLPYDPCVSAIRYAITLVDADGAEKALPPVSIPFDGNPIAFHCTSDETAQDTSTIIVPEGHFAILDLSLLVPLDADARFDESALAYEKLELVDGCRVHPSATILIETMTAALPTAQALHDALRLAPDEAGRIVVRVDPALDDNLAFVDRFEIGRQRWVWRNLPHVARKHPDAADTRERRLASGLPFELRSTDPTERDTAPAVLDFDAIAALDHSFVTRAAAIDRWPRDPNGAAARGAVLLIDDRDGQSAADYLRYSLAVESRYAPLLGGRDTRGASEKRWRRVASRRQGIDPPRPLNILAVLPLTAHPRHDPDPGEQLSLDPKRATPFLVILDEIWFREYGPGEALRAELALEEREIGDPPDGARPLRFGPMPHKHVEPRKGRPELWTDENANDPKTNAALRLECFGPFGYSLDRSGNEALANATAFIVYPPPKRPIGPQWSMAVRFRRVLHGLASDGKIEEVVGPPSGNYLLYTLADSARLVDVKEGGYLTMEIDKTDKPNGAVAFVKAVPELAPYRRDGATPAPILAQYRYALLIGPLVFDGGRGVDVFLPAQAFWVADAAKATALADLPLPAGPLQGQLIEIELGGSATTTKLDDAKSLKALFGALLPAPEAKGEAHPEDAAGRVTRVSAPFEVRPVSAP